LGIDIDRIK